MNILVLTVNPANVGESPVCNPVSTSACTLLIVARTVPCDGEVNVELDTIFDGTLLNPVYDTCPELDTVPAGNNEVTCAELLTIPEGTLLNPVYNTWAELVTVPAGSNDVT